MPAKLGVQILGDNAGLTAALGESVASANRWATETAGATTRVQEAFRATSTSALQLAVVEDKLAIATARYGQGSTGAAAATLAYRRQVDGLAASHMAAVKSIGRGLTTYVTAPTALLGYEAVKMGVNFQTEMLRIQTQAGASAQEVKNLKGQVLDLAGAVGVGPETLAQGLFHLESEGLRGTEAMKALRQAAIAAGASGANLEDVTTALGGAIVTGIKGVEDYKTAMAGLIAIAGEGNMRMEDLTEALGTGVLPAAKNAGVSLREVGAALAVLTDRGMSAEMAGTRLRMTFALMQHPSSAAKKALADLGIGSDQMAKMLQQPDGLLHVLQLLHDRMQNVGSVRGSRDILGAFGGGRSGAGILTLVQSLDSAVSSYQQKLVGYDQGVQKASSNMATYQQSDAFKLKQSGASIQADMIKFGNALKPVAVAAAETVAKVGGAFSALPGPVKTEIGVVVGMLAVGGPLILALLGARRAITALGTAFNVLPAQAAPGLAATGTEIATGVGAGVTTAEAEVAGLRASILGLGALTVAPIVVPIVTDLIVNEIQHGKHGTLSRAATAGSDAVASALGISTSSNGRGPTYQQYLDAAKHHDANYMLIEGYMKQLGITDPRQLPGGPLAPRLSATQGAGPHGAAGLSSSTDPTGPGSATTTKGGTTSTAKVTAYQPSRATELNLALAKNPNDTAAIEAKIAYDRQAAAFAERELASGKLPKRRVAEVARELQQIYGEKNSLQDQLAAMDKKNVQKKIQVAKQFAIPLDLQLMQAKADASGVHGQQVKTAAAIKKWAETIVHSKHATEQQLIDAYNLIAQENSVIGSGASTAADRVKESSRQFVSTLTGLSKAQKLELEQRFAQVQAHGGYPTNAVGAGGHSVTINVHGVHDPDTVVRKVVQHLERNQKRTVVQTRGRRGGVASIP